MRDRADRRVRGHPGGDDVAGLSDQHVDHGPQGQPAGLGQPRVPAEQRAVPETPSRRIAGSSEAACTTIPSVVPSPSSSSFGSLDPGRVQRDLAGQQREHRQHAQHDQVVQHRGPGERAERAAAVQDGAEQRADAVEEDLRQQQVGQQRGQLRVGLAGRRRRRGRAGSAAGRRAIAAAVASSRASVAMVSSRRVNASPPSASSVCARTSSGTITLLSTPPMSSS